MSKDHKDTLVRATLTTPTARRLTIPNMGETLYLRVIHEDGVIEFVPQITMKASVVGEKNGK
jgi:hypothetical protein